MEGKAKGMGQWGEGGVGWVVSRDSGLSTTLPLTAASVKERLQVRVGNCGLRKNTNSDSDVKQVVM